MPRPSAILCGARGRAAIAQRLGDMQAAHRLGAVEIGQRARDPQGAVVLQSSEIAAIPSYARRIDPSNPLVGKAAC